MSDIEARLKYLEDRFEIQDLICEYVHSMEDKDPERFKDCFTDDAEYLVGGMWGDFKGKDAIAETTSQFAFAFFESHHFTTGHHILNITGDTATGRCDAFVTAGDSEGTSIVSSASYKDEFRRCEDGKWRFSRRKIEMHYLVPWLEPQNLDESSRFYHTPELSGKLVALGKKREGASAD